MKHYLVLIFFLLFKLVVTSQINAYARITGISGGSVLTLSSVEETYDTFVAGELVIVIQMQGASISNSSNNSGFGTLNSLNSAGLYEVAKISAVNTGAGSMTLTGSLNNSYSTSGRVQVVSYPKMGTTSYTTTADIDAVSWNGSRGGVLCFYTSGNIYLNHNLSANGDGFRGGNKAGQDGSGCETSTWRTSSGDGKYADKGEGVYRVSSSEASGRAKAVNGGGGGIVHNGGGGGGGNYTAGGNGYYGFPGDGCDASTNAGGQGGIAISSSATRIFMGGGGGGGQENNSQATDGGDGGGIILISCDTIVVTGSCSSRKIQTNGSTPINSGQDGAGGGGAGGTIVLNIKGFRVVAGCPLTVSADGSAGADVIHVDTHGSGGGGGQGAIYLNTSNSFTNVTLSTNFGIGGLINNSGTSTRAESGGGPANAGIFSVAFNSPLPVELVQFIGHETEPGVVDLDWSAASELNNKLFEVYHTSEGGTWNVIGSKSGAGTTKVQQNYKFKHVGVKPGLNYYKLKQIDFDGGSKFSDISYVEILNSKLKVKTFPNPTTGQVMLSSDLDISNENFYLVNTFGNKVAFELIKNDNTSYILDLSRLEPGMYFLYSQNITEKIVLK